MKVKAYLEISMQIADENRSAAANVFFKYKEEFLKNIQGAITKDLLIRKEDIQVIHGFDSVANAENYLLSDLFKNDVYIELKALWQTDPEVKIYTVA